MRIDVVVVLREGFDQMHMSFIRSDIANRHEICFAIAIIVDHLHIRRRGLQRFNLTKRCDDKSASRIRSSIQQLAQVEFRRC